MQLRDVLPALDSLAPLKFAESWDNVGLLVGDPTSNVTRVLVTVDYTAAVAAEARSFEAELLVAYHPPLFSAVKRAPHDALWVDAIRRGIAIYSTHTAFDVVADGTNDVLADACGVHRAGRRPLKPTPSNEAIGLGRVGDVPSESGAELVQRIKTNLGLAHVLVAGSLDRSIAKVAVAAGSGAELVPFAIAAGADVMVTGELRHHDALSASARGLTVIAALHSNSERGAMHSFAARLAKATTLDVRVSTTDADPFAIV